MPTTLAQIQLRGDTAANWTSTNPILAARERGVETDTGKEKIGDGSTHWASLPYTTDVTRLPSALLGSGALKPTAGRAGSITAPVLRDVVSLADPDFGAVQDGAFVTLSFTSGNATATASSVTMTAADIGKTIAVPGAGGAGALLLSTTISGVSSGKPTLTVAPTTTVAGAAAWYGTDNTTAHIAAMTAASTLATQTGTLTTLLIPPGAPWLVGTVPPQNNVIISGYGATLLTKGGSGAVPIYSNVFSRTALLSNFRVRGLKMIGGNYSVFGTTRDDAINIYDCTGCQVEDCEFVNFADYGISFSSASALRIKNNTLVGCAQTSGNAIYVNYQSLLAWSPVPTDIEIAGNRISGCVGGGIVLGCSADTSIPNPYVPYNTHIHHNRVTTSSFACIALECGRIGAPGTTSQGSTIRNVQIDHNILTQTGAAGSGYYGIQASDNNGGSVPLTSTDPLQFADIQIDHNTITSTDGGIFFTGSNSTIDHNRITITSAASSAGISVSNNAANTTVGLSVVNNKIVMAINSNHAISGNATVNTEVAHNKIYYPTSGNTSTSIDGIHLTSLVRPKVISNIVEYASANGIRLNTCSDARANQNYIYNCGAGGGAAATTATAVLWDACTATQRSQCLGNDILDDRGIHLMYAGIYQNGGNPRLIVRDSSVYGNTFAGPITISPTIGGISTNNTGAAQQIANVTAITVTASPFTYLNAQGYAIIVGVVGGTVSVVSRIRSSTQNTGVVAGEFHLDPNESLIVTYTVAPTMYFVPTNQV